MTKDDIKHKMYSVLIQRLKMVISSNAVPEAYINPMNLEAAKEILKEIEELRDNVN